MKLIITVEKVKDGTKKVKQAMFVTYIDKDGRTDAVSEVDKNSYLGQEFESMIDQMKELKKEKKKLLKTKSKKK